MTYVKTDPSTMTSAELAAYHDRLVAAGAQATDSPTDVPHAEHGRVLSVHFSESEMTQLADLAHQTGLTTANWLRRTALDQVTSTEQ